MNKKFLIKNSINHTTKPYNIIYRKVIKIVTIYCITNLITDQYYVGQTINYNRRMNEHFTESNWKYNNNKLLYKNMEKYGLENFTHEVLDIVPECIADVTEDYWILTLNCLHNSNELGKNSNGLNAKLSDKQCTYKVETRKKMSEKRKGCTTWNKGIPHSPETRKKISEKASGRINERSRGINNAQATAITQYDLNWNLVSEYDLVKEASEVTGIYQSAILNNLRHLSKTCGGFIFRYKGDFTGYGKEITYCNGNSKKVGKIKNDIVIEEYNTISEGANDVNVSCSALSHCLNGLTKTCGGFKWKFL